MPVRPVEMLTMLPRLSETGRAQHEKETQPGLFQQVQASQMKEKDARLQQQVNRKSTSGQVSVQRDGKRGGNATGGGEEQTPGRQAKPAQAVSAPAGQHKLDVKV